MKKRSVLVISCSLIYVFVSFLFIGACAVTDRAGTSKIAYNDEPVYEVPQAKKQKWESIQKLVYNEYKVCIEHCGNSEGCIARCKKVYKTRLEREYKQLMLE